MTDRLRIFYGIIKLYTFKLKGLNKVVSINLKPYIIIM